MWFALHFILHSCTSHLFVGTLPHRGGYKHDTPARKIRERGVRLLGARSLIDVHRHRQDCHQDTRDLWQLRRTSWDPHLQHVAQQQQDDRHHESVKKTVPVHHIIKNSAVMHLMLVSPFPMLFSVHWCMFAMHFFSLRSFLLLYLCLLCFCKNRSSVRRFDDDNIRKENEKIKTIPLNPPLRNDKEDNWYLHFLPLHKHLCGASHVPFWLY